MYCPECGSEKLRKLPGSYGRTLYECKDCQSVIEVPDPYRRPKVKVWKEVKKKSGIAKFA